MKYRIFPPIGIARVGNSDEYFIGPEWPGGLGVEIGDAGDEKDVESFKDESFRLKRQAARFRIFEYEDDADTGKPIQLPEGATVKWYAHLVNKKAAIQRPNSPPLDPIMPQLAKTKGDKVLDGGKREISGRNAGPVSFITGLLPVEPHPDYLGELHTDGEQNLLVLGGKGKSIGQGGISSFYTNRDWFDDVSDGPVQAEIVASDGSVLIPLEEVEPAWVVVGPPDFSPSVQGIVTLYDVLFQVGGPQLPAQLSFTQHVYPLIKRASDLHWVNDVPANLPAQDPDYWSLVSTDYEKLSSSSAATLDLRKATASLIRNLPLRLVTLREFQEDILESWELGNVKDDWGGEPPVDRTITPDGLTRATLDGCVGQGFFPGIEAGIIVTLKDIYIEPFEFRFDHRKLVAGDITALMALPWQADFWACADAWWPSQRPDITRADFNASTGLVWDRGIDSYEEMVENANNLGMVMRTADGQGYEEVGRNPDQLSPLQPVTFAERAISVERKRVPRRKRVG